MDKHIQRQKSFWQSLVKLKSSLPALMVESILITFGVLLAFAIDSWKVEAKLQRDTEVVLENLKSELLSNRSIVLEWLSYHDSLKVKLSTVLSDWESIEAVNSFDRTYLDELYPEPTISYLLQQTAWQTAYSTGVMQNFDYLTTYNLTHCYESQQQIGQTKDFLFSKMHESSAHDSEDAKSFLSVLYSLYTELSGQEQYLLSVYRDALLEVDKELTERSE